MKLNKKIVLLDSFPGDQNPLQWGLAERPADFADLRRDVEALLGPVGARPQLERGQPSGLAPGPARHAYTG